MGRQKKLLTDYENPPPVDETEFDNAASRDMISYECDECGGENSAEKRNILSRWKSGKLICQVCTNKRNAKKKRPRK